MKLDALNSYHIDIVVNLYKNRDTDLEKHLYKYVYYPISDGKYIDPMVVDIAEYLARMISKGHVVYTHCHAGRNRSGFVNALVVRLVLGVSGEEAMNIVRRKRPRAIDNIHFENYLKGLS
jgi:protein-tyrosine phosphatase